MKHREEDRVLHHQGLILHVAVAAVVVGAEAAKAEAAVEAEVVAEVETAAIHANRTFASEHRPPTGPKSPQEAVHFHMRTR